MTHSVRAAPALAQLPEHDPAMGALALWCRHLDGEGATRTQGQTIRYGPEFCEVALPGQVALCAHHVLHVALRHGPRGADMGLRLGERFDPGLWALAADAVINETLALADYAVPRPFVRLTALLERIGRPAPSAREALADWDVDRLAFHLHRNTKDGEAARAYGQAQSFAPDLTLEKDETDTAQSPEEWRGHLVRAMAAGRAAGTGIGLLSALIADLMPPRVPWEVHLRGLLAKALVAQPARSFRRPAGRWVAMEAQARATSGPVPVFEPGRARQDWRPQIVVALDTSGSIDALSLQMLAAEIDGIATRGGAQTHLWAFDTEVFWRTRMTHGLGRCLSDAPLRRGGGTDFRPVLEAASALAPSALVVLSDLDGPTSPPPRFPVFWVARSDAKPAPFGSLVVIP